MIWILVALFASVLVLPLLPRGGPRAIALLPVVAADAQRIQAARKRSRKKQAALNAASRVLS